MTTTTGSSAATAPLTLISAVRPATSDIIRTSRRVRDSPACAIRDWPAQVVTPVASSPALTTNSEAMKITAGSPSPASDSCSVVTPVKYSASAVARDTRTTGKRSQINSTTIAMTIAKVTVTSLMSNARKASCWTAACQPPPLLDAERNIEDVPKNKQDGPYGIEDNGIGQHHGDDRPHAGFLLVPLRKYHNH